MHWPPLTAVNSLCIRFLDWRCFIFNVWNDLLNLLIVSNPIRATFSAIFTRFLDYFSTFFAVFLYAPGLQFSNAPNINQAVFFNLFSQIFSFWIGDFIKSEKIFFPFYSELVNWVIFLGVRRLGFSLIEESIRSHYPMRHAF